MRNTCKYFLIISILLITAINNKTNAQLFKGEVFAGAGMAQVDGDDCYGYDRFKGQFGAGVLLSVMDWRYKYFGTKSETAVGSSSSWLDLGLEILYNPKGAFKSDSITYSSYYAGSYDLKLNYIEIPVMVYLTDKNRYSVGLGASFGRLIGFSERVNGMETDTRIGDGKLRWKDGYSGEDLGYIRRIEDLENPAFYDSTGMLTIENSNSYKKNDFSFCADFRVRLWEGLHAQVRYQYSIVPIRTRLLYQDAAGTIPSKIRMQYNNQISLRLTYIFGEDRTRINREIQEEEKMRNRLP